MDGWCVGGCWITLAQRDPMETGVQASSGWMVHRWVLNHSGLAWSDGNRCSGIQWMDGALAGAESLWPSVIRWKLVFSSNWKNIKNRRGWGGMSVISWNGPFRHVGKESTFPSYPIGHKRMLSHHCGALLWMNEWMKYALRLSYRVCTTHLAAAF